MIVLACFIASGGVLMGYTGPLADKDRIFTNLYGFQAPWLKAAQARGDWDNTKALMAIGQDAIIDRSRRRGCAAAAAPASRPA